MIAPMTWQACVELARAIGRDPVDVAEQWNERAAIREFDGDQDRADAERDAFEDVRRALDPGALIAGPRRGPLPAADRAADADAARRLRG
jgi:hypothetical protein